MDKKVVRFKRIYDKIRKNIYYSTNRGFEHTAFYRKIYPEEIVYFL